MENNKPGLVDFKRTPIHVCIIGDIGIGTTCREHLDTQEFKVTIIEEKPIAPTEPKEFLIIELPKFNVKLALREPKPFYLQFEKKRKKKKK